MNTINATSASQIAKYFLWKATKEGKTLSNKKLQKLVYYAQAWLLCLKKNRFLPIRLKHGFTD